MVDLAASSACCCLTTLAPAAPKRVPRLDMDSIPMFKDFKLPRRSPSTEDEASSSSNDSSNCSSSKSEGEVRHERRPEDISSQPAPTHSGPTTDWRHMLRLAHEDQQRRQGGDAVSMLTDRFR